MKIEVVTMLIVEEQKGRSQPEAKPKPLPRIEVAAIY